MGQNFISYCVFGPTKLDTSPETMAKALEVVLARIALVKEIQRLESSNVDEDDLRLVQLLREHKVEFIDDTYWILRHADSPMTPINDLIDVWVNGSADSSSRTVPGQPDKMVWFAGDMTWGDEPDGFGYQTMKQSEEIGLLSIFGLE